MILSIFTTGFSPESGLLFIAVRSHTGEIRAFKGIEEFIEYFLKTDDKIVVGFNILKFDIPFLLLKSGNSSRFREFFKKINYSNIVDLFTILTFQNKGIIKGLDFYLEKEGIERNFLSDPEIVNRLSKNDSSEEEIRKKLNAIHELYWKLREKVI